jgi:hypothetical protein
VARSRGVEHTLCALVRLLIVYVLRCLVRHGCTTAEQQNLLCFGT